MKKIAALLLLVLMLSGCVTPTPQLTATFTPETQTATPAPTQEPTLPVTPRERPRIMLFIGDGMGAEHRRAGQYYELGEVRPLAMDSRWMPLAG